QVLLADVLSWNKKYAESAALFSRLQRDHPRDGRLTIRLARVALWAGEYDTALERYQALLDKDRDQPLPWGEDTDAAARAKEVGAKQKSTVLYICEKGVESRAKDAVFLGRLAWVLRRVEERDKGVDLLKKALAIDPESRTTRLQLAEALY